MNSSFARNNNPSPKQENPGAEELNQSMSPSAARAEHGLYGAKVAEEVFKAAAKLYHDGLITARGLEQYDSILRLRLNGCTYQEIGEALGCTRQNVEHYMKKLSAMSLLSPEAEDALHQTAPNFELQEQVLNGIREGKSLAAIAREVGCAEKTVHTARTGLLSGPRREETLAALEERRLIREIERELKILNKASEYTNLRLNHNLKDKEIMEIMGIKHPPELYAIKSKAEEIFGHDEVVRTMFHQRIYTTPPTPPPPDYEAIRQRQERIHELVLEGKSSKEMSAILNVSRTTIDNDILALRKNLPPEDAKQIVAARIATRRRLRLERDAEDKTNN